MLKSIFVTLSLGYALMSFAGEEDCSLLVISKPPESISMEARPARSHSIRRFIPGICKHECYGVKCPGNDNVTAEDCLAYSACVHGGLFTVTLCLLCGVYS